MRTTGILSKLLRSAGLLLSITFMFMACNNKINVDTDTQGEGIVHQSAPIDNIFRVCEIPTILTRSEDRAAYLAQNYWKNFNFSDIAFINKTEVIEQAFVDFLSVLSHTPPVVGIKSINTTLDRSIAEDKTGKMYSCFLELYNKYLSDPNSPFRNEEFYIHITEFIMSDSLSDEAVKSRANFEHKMMLKNRVGTKAANFSYITTKGTKGNLYQLNKMYTLIYFYNPGCVACQEIIDYMKKSSMVNHLLNKDMIDILAVYTDTELDKWRGYSDKMPTGWINGCDKWQDINQKQIYDLKAIPTIYLLDRNKEVLLKDANFIDVESYLKINNPIK